MTNAKIGIALAGGYVLGRTKKAKLALGLGMYLAGKKLDLNPAALRKALAASPVVGELRGQAGEQLLTATRSAAKGALTKRVGSIADSLHSRTQGLGLGSGADEGAARADEPEQADDADEAAEADRADEADGADDERDGAPSRRSSTGRTAKKTAKKAAQRPAKKTAGSASGRAEGARKSASSARKSASASGRKAAGSARGTASRTSRTTRGTGGKGGDRG